MALSDDDDRRGKRKAGRPAASSGADTKKEIMKMATQMYITSGRAAMSLDAIAKAAGITRTALYYYFPSKEALLAAVLHQSVESVDWQWWHGVTGAEGRTGSFHRRLHSFMSSCLSATINDQTRGEVYFSLVKLSTHDNDVRATLSAHLRAMGQAIDAMLTQAIDDGELPETVNRAELIESIFGLVWVFSSGVLSAPTPRVIAQITSAVDLICNDIGSCDHSF